MFITLFVHLLVGGVGILALVQGLIVEKNPMALLIVFMSLGGLLAFWIEVYEKVFKNEK